MKKVKIILVFALVMSLKGFVLAQSDSTDLNFFYVEPVMANAMDSLNYLEGDLVEYRLEFEIEELDSLGKIWIEFIHVPESMNASLLFHQSYTPTQLTEQELLDGNAVSISFGSYYVGAAYQASLRLEGLEGNEMRTITKLLVP